MLAKRIPTILPDLSESEMLETTKIYSYLGKFNQQNNLIFKPPLRSPHHTISKRITVVVVSYSDLLKNNSVTPQYDCLNQSSQLSGMLSSLYHTSFMRQVVSNPMI